MFIQKDLFIFINKMEGNCLTLRLVSFDPTFGIGLTLRLVSFDPTFGIGEI
jgi:hypothetical protein